MEERLRLGLRIRGFGSICLMLAAAACAVLSFKGDNDSLSAASQAALRQPRGYPQLVSVEPLSAPDGEMCHWIPASATSHLRENFLEQEGTESQLPTAAP